MFPSRTITATRTIRTTEDPAETTKRPPGGLEVTTEDQHQETGTREETPGRPPGDHEDAVHSRIYWRIESHVQNASPQILAGFGNGARARRNRCTPSTRGSRSSMKVLSRFWRGYRFRVKGQGFGC